MPFNYKNSGEHNNEDEGLLAGKFPTLSWSKDEYTNWLTQNSVNIGLGVASNLITIIGGMGIANQLGEIYQHSLIPNSAKGNINGR